VKKDDESKGKRVGMSVGIKKTLQFIATKALRAQRSTKEFQNLSLWFLVVLGVLVAKVLTSNSARFRKSF
jgi:hypothetical protein